MSVFGVFIGGFLVLMGIITLTIGLTGKGIRIKAKAADLTKETEEQLIRKGRRTSTIAGIIGIFFGTITILAATVWAP